MYEVEIEKTTNRADDEVKPNWHMQKSWAMHSSAVDRDVTPRLCHTSRVFSVLLTERSQQFLAFICIPHFSQSTSMIIYRFTYFSRSSLAWSMTVFRQPREEPQKRIDGLGSIM